MRIGLPEGHGLSEFVLDSAELMPRTDEGPLLTDIQYEALEAGVGAGASVLVSAPTSTGKTLIGWWAISSALSAGRRCVYLVSHRALAKQKFEEAQRLFLRGVLEGDRSSIVCATGDGVEDASGRKTNAPMSAYILVATYEKFLGCLSVGGPPRDLTDVTFVCDEVQLVGDPNRGQNVELLLTLMRRAKWQQLVCLSAVLSEGDATSLSDWLDVQLVRNPSREKSLIIECRAPTEVHSVSAGPGRIGDMQTEPERRTLQTNAIVDELLRSGTRSPVIVFCMKVDDTYTLCRERTATLPPSEQVRPPAGTELDVTLEAALSRRAAFHNAEISEEERVFIEERISAGAVDVVYATSTLAAGVNFPLGSAVFGSWTRWNFDKKAAEPIGRAEFQNMAGRVGRMGQTAAEGLVILTADGGASAASARRLMDLSGQDDLGEGIKPDDFATLTLQIFSGRLCESRDEAFDLIGSTLSASREVERNRQGISHWRQALDRQIDRLIQTNCLVEYGQRIHVTPFGTAVSRSGLKPETALYFIGGLAGHSLSLKEMLADYDDDALFILSHAALTCPEFNSTGGRATRHIGWRVGRNNLVANSYARRLARSLWAQPWEADPSAANGALLIADWASGRSRREVEALVAGVRLGTVEGMARDVAWILSGVAEIIYELTSPTLADESKPAELRGDGDDVKAVRQLLRAVRRFAGRVASGLPSDVLWMLQLELAGPRRRLSRSQILGLRYQRLIKPHEVMDGSEEFDRRRRLALAATDNPAIANLTRDAARRWKSDEREHFKRIHTKRAERVAATEEVRALYQNRGTDLETAFEAALALVSIAFERLDTPGRRGYPDYLLSVEDFPPVVVEIKSRQSDSDLVTLNGATEVLAASEVAGFREAPCITLCSPGFDPSVPGSIEKCSRLTVLEVSSIVEAVLRLREGSLTREDFYNWLTVPGVVHLEDLPAPER